MRPGLLLALTLTLAAALSAQNPLPLREQARLQDQWLDLRLERVLPALMREHGVQMWIVTNREYGEDPVFSSLAPATEFAGGRRDIFVFFDPGPGKPLERFVVGRSGLGGRFKVLRPEATTPDPHWGMLAKLAQEKQPRTIAVNMSDAFAFADGLRANDWEKLREAFGPDLSKRLVRRERLALDYIATRLPDMMPTYRELMALSHSIIREAFSAAVVKPGITTPEDVAWWMRQRALDHGFPVWFQPTVDIQRKGGLPKGVPNPPIQRGDVLHCDFGFTALRLNTDTQHMGYVLREGETDAPEGLRKALANGNRLQDIHLAHMVPGRTGNEVLLGALAQMKSEGITGSIYTHPIGQHGHGAGPTIGLWDQQRALPFRGDVPLRPHTWFSIELQATTPVPEWDGQPVKAMLEEEAALDGTGKVSWVRERQSRYHLIR